MDDNLNIKQACQYIHKSEKTLRRYISKGFLKSIKKNGKIFILKSDLDSIRHLVDTNWSDDQVLKDNSNNKIYENDTIDTNNKETDSSHKVDINRTGNKEKITLEDILNAVNETKKSDVLVSYQDPAIINELKEEKEKLRQENLQFANRLGKLEQENLQLKEQLKALQEPKVEKKKWWTFLNKKIW